MILVSILLIMNPVGVLNVVTIVFGIGVLVEGLFHIVSYFGTEKELRVFSGDLFEGIIATIAGVFILCNKAILISMLPLVIGIWMIIRSIMKLQLAFNLKSAESSNWGWVLVSAIISILLGILIMMNPFGTALTVTVLAGIILLISAIVDLAENLTVLKTLKKNN